MVAAVMLSPSSTTGLEYVRSSTDSTGHTNEKSIHKCSEIFAVAWRRAPPVVSTISSKRINALILRIVNRQPRTS